MATQMTNTVPGTVTFTKPVLLKVQRVDASQSGNSTLGLERCDAVHGVWTTNATGTDGKITVSSILPVNEDVLVTLASTIILDTLVANSPNIVAIQ